MNKNELHVKKFVIQDNMKYNRETVATYKIEYPQFYSRYCKSSLNQLNKYYLKKALQLEQFYKRELYKPAIDDYKDAKENNLPVKVYEGLAKYKVSYNKDCILSVVYDNYIYSGGAHGNTVRTSETWKLQDGRRIKLDEFFNNSPDYKDYIFNHIRNEIQKDLSIYFDDYDKLISDTFQTENFYYTPKGVVIYYQQYDIAPYSSGIREFLIPYTVSASYS